MKWILPEDNNLPMLENLLKMRNIGDPQKFFNPSHEHFYDPFLLYDINKAVKAIESAVRNNRKIYIHGDFDVDGVTGTSIMWSFLYREMGADALAYIPSRFDEGYGLSEKSVESILENSGEVIITVDCGVKDIELVNNYYDKIDFIISDHHTILTKEASGHYPAGSYATIGEHLVPAHALAVVHPQLGGRYPFKEICGAAVSWKICCALNDSLNIGVDMGKYLDLAALGTVCDVMPLVDENRTIASLGLEQAKRTVNTGLKELIDVAGVEQKNLKIYHFGFVLGPRLNAAGRLESAIDSVRLLTTNSALYARQIAKKIDHLNSKRQLMTQKLLTEAESQLSAKLDKKLLFVYGKDWSEGIVGLIAGKLTEKYNRPAIVGTIQENVLKASARSTEYFNIAAALKEGGTLLLRHGGHAQAAGFSLEVSNLKKFEEFIVNLSESELTQEHMTKNLYIDMNSHIGELTFDLAKSINKLEPFGYGNRTPVISVMNVNLKRFKVFGKEDSHVRLIISDATGKEIECLGFNFAEKFYSRLNLSQMSKTSSILDNQNLKIDVAGNLDINEWNNVVKTIIKIKDIKESSK